MTKKRLNRSEKAPTAIQWYAALLATGSVAMLVTSALQPGATRLTPDDLLASLVLVLLIAAARRFPLHFASKTKIVVDTSLIFAALLLLPMPWGPLVAGAGVLLGHLLFWRAWLDIVVNTSVVVVQAACAQWAYRTLGGSIPIKFDTVAIAWPAMVAGLAILITERLLVGMAVAVHRRANFAQVFSGLWVKGVREDACLLLLGLLAVLVIQVQPLALLLLLIPIAVVYRGLHTSLQALSWEAVEALADVIDQRDHYTAGHSKRVSELARRLAVEMGLSRDQVTTIRLAARVHDLGKIAIDSSILSKPSPLTEEEWDLMRHHPLTAVEIISRVPKFSSGADCVLHHHERWDGSGYPDGLRGDLIPIGACIIAVADGYDAMMSDRPYRQALTLDVVMEEFRRGAGMQWNEKVVLALFRVLARDGVAPSRAGVPAPITA